MNERIALGFHTCVDYELEWDTRIIEAQIKAFDIHAEELKMDIAVDSERAIWIVSLAHLKAGIGCEIVPDSSCMCVEFANHFTYEVTLGGTSTRAGMILSGLGYPSILQTSCYNEYVRRLMPPGVRVLPGTGSGTEEVFPHIVLQCSKGIRIHGNDIDFTTPKENRILISRDRDSLHMPVLTEEFGKMIGGCEVFLLGSFSEVLDWDVLKDRVEKTKKLLSYLPEDGIVVMEDGCYARKEFRSYVHRALAPQVYVLSMNEDELQQYIGTSIDILDPKEVENAVKYVYDNTAIKLILVHSAAWALVYGKKAGKMKSALEGGVTMAATRFRMGDHFTARDCMRTKDMSDNLKGAGFCKKLEEKLGDMIYCIPCKELSYVEHPTVVGLGDAFAGGLLPGLLKENRKKTDA